MSERTDAHGEEGPAHRLNHVKGSNTGDLDAMLGVEENLGWNIANELCHRGHHDPGEDGDSGSTGAELRLNRRPRAYFDDLVASREAEGTRIADDEVLGATVLVIVDAEDSHYAIWTLDDVVFELASITTPSFEESAFRSLLGSLTIVDEETWLAAMPETVVTDRAAAVAVYLADIPLPTGYDPTDLAQGPAEDWYQVGADVAGAATCAWIEQWMAAKAAGDRAAVDEAVAAMATSREWGILVEMSSLGDYPEAVWRYADALAGDGTIAAGGVTTVEESYRQTLCSG